ncbi:MAG: hypothetical protein LBI53_01455 [Candidatus Peribacteria bacterium]|nr:hypothetical protein [Candidatus Peribacteria bacterium]
MEDVVYRGDVPENRRDNPSGDPDNERNDPPENPEDENKRKEIKKFWEDFDRKTKFVPYKPVDPEKEPEKFYKDDFSDRKLDKRTPGTKQTVNTRGQKIEGYDSFDYGTGYPEAGKRPSISELSHKIFTETSLFPEDQQEILSLRKRGATMDEVGEFIKKKITKEREKAEIKKGKRQFNALLDQCYNKIPEYLSKILGSDITEKFNIPLSKDRVHLVGDAEYRAVA